MTLTSPAHPVPEPIHTAGTESVLVCAERWGGRLIG